MTVFDFSKVLITGADGMVGHYVDFGFKTNRSILDVTDFKKVISVFNKYKPKAVIHLAAETDVDKCERDPAAAYSVNSMGAYNVAVAAKAVSAKVVYISTAGVFDGVKETPYKEDDVPNPINHHGKSKLLGELAIRGVLDDYLILRVCWMFGGGPAIDKKFVAKIINQIKNPEIKEIKALSDQFGSPTFGKDLVAAIKRLLIEGKKGVFHTANTGSASRYDFAENIVRLIRPEVEVSAVTSPFFKLDAMRPRSEVIVSELNLMRTWQEALEEYLLKEWNEIPGIKDTY